VIRVEQKSSPEAVDGFLNALNAQRAHTPAIERVHLVFAAIQSMRLGELPRS
jgi:hypothetical protein